MLFTKLIYKLSISQIINITVSCYWILYSANKKKSYLTLYGTNTINCRYTVIGKRMEGGKDWIDIERKCKLLKATWGNFSNIKTVFYFSIIDSYLDCFQVDINYTYILSLSETKSSNVTIIAHSSVFYKEIEG